MGDENKEKVIYENYIPNDATIIQMLRDVQSSIKDLRKEIHDIQQQLHTLSSSLNSPQRSAEASHMNTNNNHNQAAEKQKENNNNNVVPPLPLPIFQDSPFMPNTLARIRARNWDIRCGCPIPFVADHSKP